MYMEKLDMDAVELPTRAFSPGGEERRSFLGLACSVGVAIFGAVCSVPFLRYVAYPMADSESKNKWTELGAVGEFDRATGPVRKLISVEKEDGWQQTSAQEAVFVTRDADGALAVLSSVCPHLGCSVEWKPDREKFVCPCHGGCFAANGQKLSGPPPSNMKNLAVKTEGERLWVNYTNPSRKNSAA